MVREVGLRASSEMAGGASGTKGKLWCGGEGGGEGGIWSNQ